MNAKQVTTVSVFSWLGMIAFLILGAFVHIESEPFPELECPNYVWDMIESGSLKREDITKSRAAMSQQNCNWTEPETRPFSATSWILFGTITGFTFGTLLQHLTSPPGGQIRPRSGPHTGGRNAAGNPSPTGPDAAERVT